MKNLNKKVKSFLLKQIRSEINDFNHKIEVIMDMTNCSKVEAEVLYSKLEIETGNRSISCKLREEAKKETVYAALIDGFQRQYKCRFIEGVHYDKLYNKVYFSWNSEKWKKYRTIAAAKNYGY